MLMPNVDVHMGLVHSEAHEGVLLNTLKHELEEAVRAYLHQTQRAFPISLVFDMSST